MRVPITLDLHLPNFNFPGVGPDDVFDKLAEISLTAERSGFSSVSVMDHLHQIRGVGPPENWMFDGNTVLAGLAARTETLTLGTLVGGVTYRNPALLAKITTTLDIVSGGRAWCGIGAAWNEEEHRAYGFDFPPLKVRFEMLEDALQIMRAMFTEERATYAGRHFSVEGAYNNPKPIRGDIPILIGGSGERKTLRLVAQYADGCNLFAADPETARHKLDVLEQHCENVGRDPSEITKTKIGIVLVGATREAAHAKVQSLERVGISRERLSMATIGDPDEISEWAAGFADVGIEGLTISLPDVHDFEAIELAGRALAPVFAGQSV
jgi:F420-dependent oxidoreductase-like protein